MLASSFSRGSPLATFTGGPGALVRSSGPPGRRRAASAKLAAREEPWFLPRRFWLSPSGHRISRFLATLAVMLLTLPAIAASPGALIQNRATLDFESPPGLRQTQDSNLVEATVAVLRSPANIALMRVVGAGGQFEETVGPSACFDGNGYVTLTDPPAVGGTAIDTASPQQVSATVSYNQGEPVFIRLEDADQNLDFQVLDKADVSVGNSGSGDVEVIQLTETGPNTGVFSGYVLTAAGGTAAQDCVLQVTANSDVSVDYDDPADPTDGLSLIHI